ncbi:MAG TPA: hypothetical protein VLS93_08210 [Anaeromyxobacteraceae bacterium]|nr:hypothetical protein [Anaeromyxobacteraceae bacterium]
MEAREARELLGRLAGEVSRPEVPSPCRSTTRYFADLDVACELDGKSVHEEVSLSTSDCHPDEAIADGVGASTSWGGPPGGYARAIGAHDLVKKLVVAMPPGVAK